MVIAVSKVYIHSVWVHLSAWHCAQVRGCCTVQLLRTVLSAKNSGPHSVILDAVSFMYEEPEGKSVLE